MGKSLTFEQSVMETLDLTKNYKCKNPICETQRWKVQHELDLALLKIERLHMRLRTHGFEIQEKAVWRDNRPKAITFREEPDVCNMPRKRKNFKQQASQDKPSYDVHKENKEFPLANDKTHIVPASRPSSTPEQEHKPKTSPSFWKSKKKDKDKSATPSPQPYRSKTPPPPYNAVDPKNKTRHLGGRQYSGVRSDPPIDHLEMETVL
ncbi:uncharacterized protein LOC106164912 [Lingula anatina]|nr:uncharacterized protein LOC106164912 [Lingula anatina]|eukprot:XP_013398414.1 uncharacterized protein LOC106164912 [Lingula anatina]